MTCPSAFNVQPSPVLLLRLESHRSADRGTLVTNDEGNTHVVLEQLGAQVLQSDTAFSRLYQRAHVIDLFSLQSL